MVRQLFPFELGRVYATRGAMGAMIAANTGGMEYLLRHAIGDYGVIDPDDAKLNDEAVSEGGRVLSAYDLPTGTRIWIITEADRSATTILLPDEY